MASYPENAAMRHMISAMALGFACLAAQGQPLPLQGHPGNIFVSGENVVVPLASAGAGPWRLIDYDGRTVERGTAKDEKAALGKLPVGFYMLRSGNDGVTLGVLARLEAPTPADSPIGAVAVPSYFFASEQALRTAASLLSLAGIRWAGDHFRWPDIEPQPGIFAQHVADDTADAIFASAGIRVMNTMFAAPPWTHAEAHRFPSDLRAVFGFYRQLAGRWRGRVAAIEPWNEPNFFMSGAEMASYQKAAYLGLKAGNPRIIVGSQSWAIMPRVLPTPGDELEFSRNDVAPYFDTYNFHHYAPISQLPAIYRVQRPYAAGKPIWITEFNYPVAANPKSPLQDPSPHDMRIQAERVPKLFAATLAEGVQRAFYFIFPNYTEIGEQFGVLRHDLTPRPAYLALAAVGRLLAAAKPLGRIEGGERAGQVYAFSARPDGHLRDVLVAWTDAGISKIVAPAAPIAVYDFVGRKLACNRSRSLSLSSSAIFVILPAGSVKIRAARKGPLGTAGQHSERAAAAPPSPVVLQAVFNSSELVTTAPSPQLPGHPLVHPQARMSSPTDQVIRLYAYNFSGAKLQIHLSASVPRKWNYSLPTRAQTIEGGDRVAIPFAVEAPSHDRGRSGTIFVHASDSSGRISTLCFELMP